MNICSQRDTIIRELATGSLTTRQLRDLGIMSTSARITELDRQGAAIYRDWSSWTDDTGRRRKQRRYTLMSVVNYDPTAPIPAKE